MWFFLVHLWYLYFFEFCTEWLKHKWCDTRELKMQTSLCISKMAKWYKLNWVDFLIWSIAIELSQFEIASVVSFYQGKLYFWKIQKNIYRVFFITTGLKQFKTTHFFFQDSFFVLTLKQTFLNYLWDFRFMCFTSVCHLLFSRRRYCDCPCSVSSDVWWFYCFRKYWK